MNPIFILKKNIKYIFYVILTLSCFEKNWIGKGRVHIQSNPTTGEPRYFEVPQDTKNSSK